MAARVNKQGKSLQRRTKGSRRLSSNDAERLVRFSRAERLFRLVAFCFLTFALLVGLFYLGRKGFESIVNSPKLALKSVHVVGNKELSKKEILTTGMIKEGTPILELDPAVIAAKLAAHPWVRDVNIQRQLPENMLIEISERTPVAVIALEKLYLVDDEGWPFAVAPLSKVGQFPLITGFDKQFFNEHKEDAESLVKLAYQTVTLLKNHDAFKNYTVEEVHCNTFSGIEVELAPGPMRINLGYGNYASKLDKAARVLATLKHHGKKARILYLDNNKQSQREQVIAQLASR